MHEDARHADGYARRHARTTIGGNGLCAHHVASPRGRWAVKKQKQKQNKQKNKKKKKKKKKNNNNKKTKKKKKHKTEKKSHI